MHAVSVQKGFCLAAKEGQAIKCVAHRGLPFIQLVRGVSAGALAALDIVEQEPARPHIDEPGDQQAGDVESEEGVEGCLAALPVAAIDIPKLFGMKKAP
jgi:hypothetical protein